MKRISIFSILFLLIFSACNNEADFPGKPGNPQLSSINVPSSAFFGDSIPFSALVGDTEVPLSTLKAQLFFGDVKVSETTIRTKADGTYSGKLFVPFLKNIPDGTATLKIILQNIHFTLVEQEASISLKRPQYEYVTVIPEDGESFKLLHVSENTYAAQTGAGIPQMMKATIVAPKFGANGNAITFGWEGSGIEENSASPITFLSLASSPYEVTFNALSYERTPFTVYKLNGKDMSFVDAKFQIDVDLRKGETITTENIAGISGFWTDPDFFTSNAEGQIQFAAIDGKYRIIVEEGPVSYLRVQTLAANGEKASLQADGSGAVWIAGYGIAKPAMTIGQPGWEPGKMLCLAPVEAKKYRMTMTASAENGVGQIRADWIGFKIFHQDGWGGEFNKAGYTEIYFPDAITMSNSGDYGLADGMSLAAGKVYVLTLDCTAGRANAKITIEEK